VPEGTAFDNLSNEELGSLVDAAILDAERHDLQS
jgi:hypothetical protein